MSGFVVGWRSVRWPPHGAGILAHEMGHAISSRSDLNTGLNAVLACNQELHKRVYSANPINNLIRYDVHDEEDWADSFSIEILKQLRRTSPENPNYRSGNLACPLFNIENKTRHVSQAELNLYKESSESHSTSLFRLLKIQAQLSDLPSSCGVQSASLRCE